jgi:hypothetical protein
MDSVMRKPTIDRAILQWALSFALVGAGLGLAAFISGIRDTGYAQPSLRTVVLGTLALWPEYFCGRESLSVNLGLCNSLWFSGDAGFFISLFGFPILGWAIIGTLIGYWRAKYRGSGDDDIRL